MDTSATHVFYTSRVYHRLQRGLELGMCTADADPDAGDGGEETGKPPRIAAIDFVIRNKAIRLLTTLLQSSHKASVGRGSVSFFQSRVFLEATFGSTQKSMEASSLLGPLLAAMKSENALVPPDPDVQGTSAEEFCCRVSLLSSVLDFLTLERYNVLFLTEKTYGIHPPFAHMVAEAIDKFCDVLFLPSNFVNVKGFVDVHFSRGNIQARLCSLLAQY